MVRFDSVKNFSGLGIILGLGCALMFSLGSLQVKLLNSNASTPMHAILLASLRQTMVLLVAAPQVAFFKASYIGERCDWPFLILRSISGGCAIVCSFVAFSYLPISDAGVILATTPSFTTLLSAIFLREKCHISDVPVLFITLTGVVFILRPAILFQYIVPAASLTDDIAFEDRLKGSAFALAGAIIQSGVYISFRKLRRANYATVSFTYGLISLPILWAVVAAMGIYQTPSCYGERAMALGIGTTAALAQALMTIASKFIPPGIVSLLRSVETLLNFVWTVLFLGGKVNPFSVIGCVLVAIAISFLSLRTVLTQKYPKPEDRSQRMQQLFFIFK